MPNQDVLNYVDDVISKTNVPDEYKIQLENELIRNIIKASESSSIDEIKKYLSSPKELANEITVKFNRNNINNGITSMDGYGGYEHHYNRHPPRQRYCGEYMREQSNVNLKLLYIPLVQISSGTERISMPLMDDC